MKAAMAQVPSGANGTGAKVAQQTAQNSLDQLLGLLNTQAGGRYLFGRATDQPAVETTDHILNGNGAQAGFEAADFGTQPGRPRHRRPRPVRQSAQPAAR